MIHKAVFIVPVEKGGFRIEPCRRTQCRFLELLEIVAGLATAAFAQLAQDMDAASAVHRYQPAIEGAVERGRQQQAIGGVVAVLAGGSARVLNTLVFPRIRLAPLLARDSGHSRRDV